MTEFNEGPQEVKEVPQETQEVAEARQELDRATLEPAAAVERSADIKTAEAVEAAVKEAVDAAVPAANGGRETEKAAEAAADRGQETEDGSRETGYQEGSPAVQDVSRAAAPTSGVDYTAEMTGAKPGEVRGFENETDGSQAYELKTDSRTESYTVQEQIQNLEAAQGTPPESAEAVTLRPVDETASPVVEEASAESGEVQRGDELEETAAPTLGVESAAEDSATAAASQVVSGGGAPSASGLPVDDGPEGSAQDTASAGETRESVSAPVERAPSSSDAAAELDPNAYAQEVLDEAFAEQTEDLEFYAEKVQFYNDQKEAVRDYVEDLGAVSLPQTSPESLVAGLSQDLAGAGMITITDSTSAEPVDQAYLRDQLLGETSENTADSIEADDGLGSDSVEFQEVGLESEEPVIETDPLAQIQDKIDQWAIVSEMEEGLPEALQEVLESYFQEIASLLTEIKELTKQLENILNQIEEARDKKEFYQELADLYRENAESLEAQWEAGETSAGPPRELAITRIWVTSSGEIETQLVFVDYVNGEYIGYDRNFVIENVQSYIQSEYNTSDNYQNQSNEQQEIIDGLFEDRDALLSQIQEKEHKIDQVKEQVEQTKEEYDQDRNNESGIGY